jgi:hypothetical protein
VTYEAVEVGEVRGVRPDVGMWQLQALSGEAQAGTAIITPAPVESQVALEIPLRLHRVTIRTTASQQLVTLVSGKLR